MIRLNGNLIQTEHFPNNETKVKDIEKCVASEKNRLEFWYENDAELLIVEFVKYRLRELGVPYTVKAWIPYELGYHENDMESFMEKYNKVCNTIDPKAAIDIFLEFKYRSDHDLVALMKASQNIGKCRLPCTLFVWYMPYSRMDRKIEGDLFTLQYVCDYINRMKFTKVVVMEPHSIQTMKLLKRATAVYPVKDWLPEVQKEIGFGENDHIVFPDKGAAARYADSGYANVCVMEKKRNPFTGQIENMYLKEGKVNPGSKCIIIDDLCSKGGTFAWASSILRSLGASEVYLIVSHCEDTLFDGKLLDEDSPVSRIYTSTSMMNIPHPKIKFMDVDVNTYINL